MADQRNEDRENAEEGAKNSESQGFETYGGRLGCMLFFLFLVTIPLSKCGTSAGSQLFGPHRTENATVVEIDTSYTRQNYDKTGGTQRTDVFVKTEDGVKHRFVSASAIHFVELEQVVPVERSLWTGRIQSLTAGEKVHPLHLFEKIYRYGLLALFALIIAGIGFGSISMANDGKPTSFVKNMGAAFAVLVVIAAAVAIGFFWETRKMAGARSSENGIPIQEQA